MHQTSIDSFCANLLSCLYDSASLSLPIRPNRPTRATVGWNDHVKAQQKTAQLWNNIWVELGCPRAGIVSELRRKTKNAYKYAVRRVRRRKTHIHNNKIAMALSNKNHAAFWRAVKIKKSSHRSLSKLVDGLHDGNDIAECFKNKFQQLLNLDDPCARSNLHTSIKNQMNSSDIADTQFCAQDTEDALLSLGRDKSDGTGLSSNLFVVAAKVLAAPLAKLFTVILKHGYMPQLLRDCILVPVPKPNKNATCSKSYRPIALAPHLSKVLEKCILMQYSSFFATSDLQFGFKQGFSTNLCTGIVKNIAVKYVSNGTNIFGCFLDASKAFDRVNHSLLFKALWKRKLPLPVMRLLLTWYSEQSLSIRWGPIHSTSFGVANGVRQGGVLSPILFTVYLDELIKRIKATGVGCHFNCHAVGCLSYADDLVLLAPSPSALRIMLRVCELFASEFGLVFNASKTQLICFRRAKVKCDIPSHAFEFVGQSLTCSDKVIHLGHLLHYNLEDTLDIERVIAETCRKANYLLCTFPRCSPIVKNTLITTHCLSLYGGVLWKLNNKRIKSLDTAFNNILRKVWRLPQRCHTGILHCVAHTDFIINILITRFNKFIYRAINSTTPLVKDIYTWAIRSMYTTPGSNRLHQQLLKKQFSDTDHCCADYIRDIRLGSLTFESKDIMNTILTSVCCD